MTIFYFTVSIETVQIHSKSLVKMFFFVVVVAIVIIIVVVIVIYCLVFPLTMKSIMAAQILGMLLSPHFT